MGGQMWGMDQLCVRGTHLPDGIFELFDLVIKRIKRYFLCQDLLTAAHADPFAVVGLRRDELVEVEICQSREKGDEGECDNVSFGKINRFEHAIP